MVSPIMKAHSEALADHFIKALEQGTARWQKPWNPGELQQQYNPTTGKPYRGINQFWLEQVANIKGYSDPRWMTYNQAQAIGAQVPKGQKGTSVEYWQWSVEKPLLDDNGNKVRDEQGNEVMQSVRLDKPRTFYAKVFNAEQIEGVKELPAREVMSEFQRHEMAEKIIANSASPIRYLPGDAAYYHPRLDQITLPERDQFKSAEMFYATAFHEIGHSTGHATRLNRDLAHPFGSEGYAREELNAELASYRLSQETGLAFDPGNHHAYVGGWIKAIKEDPRAIFRAAAQAEHICAYVLSYAQEQEKQQEIQAQLIQAAKIYAVKTTQLEQGETNEKSAQQEATVTSERVDLNVPFAEKNEAKALGAKWDKDGQTWYVPAGVDPAGFSKWMGEKEQAAQVTKAPAKTAPERHYLTVPFGDKDEAKALGAKWDRKASQWYVPSDLDRALFAKWDISAEQAAEKSQAKASAYVATPEEEFGQAIRDLGLKLEGPPIMDGEFHRCAVDGDERGEKSGVYKGHNDSHLGNLPAGFIRNYRSGIKTNWKYSQTTPRLSPEDRKRQEAEHAAKLAEREAARDRDHRRAADAIEKVIQSAVPLSAGHAYVAKKDVSAQGVVKMQDVVPFGDGVPQKFGGKDHLLIPAHDIDGKVWTAQAIAPDGTKIFPRGARKEGSHHLIGSTEGDEPILFCEGWATGRELHDRTGLPVVVCFDAGNLKPVAEAYRERHPERLLIVAGDNDHKREKEFDERGVPKPNVGKEKALATAAAVGGYALLPAFGGNADGSDWNDLRVSVGLESQLLQLREGIENAKRQHLSFQLEKTGQGVSIRNNLTEQAEERVLQHSREKAISAKARERTADQRAPALNMGR